MIGPAYICFVQARGGPNNANAISNPDRVAGHVASRDSAGHLRRRCSEHHHDSGIHPRLGCNSGGGLSLPRLNRKTALCHTVRRNMAGPASAGARARAREDRPTHRPSGNGKLQPAFLWHGLTFSLAFSLYERDCTVTPHNPLCNSPGPLWPHGNRSTSFRGAFLFSALCFCFNSGLPRFRPEPDHAPEIPFPFPFPFRTWTLHTRRVIP